MIKKAPDGSAGTDARTHLQVFQAIYGERDRGHGLLRTSATSLRTEVLAFTDRPGECPGNS